MVYVAVRPILNIFSLWRFYFKYRPR